MSQVESPDQVRWDARYRDSDKVPEPALVLSEFQHLLPRSGEALDLACGLGGNALLLAAHGLKTHAWDISPVAIDRVKQEAASRGVDVETQVRDVVAAPPEPASFDVIVVSRFLERKLVPSLIQALRPGGLIYYHTFTIDRVRDTGPKNPEYRLADNELLALLASLRLIIYREEGLAGDLSKGVRGEAMLVAQRRPNSLGNSD